MPTGEVNYENGMIYTIRSRDSVYVGSTTNFKGRKRQHKSNININKQFKLYQTIRANDFEWDMKPYKLFPCNHKVELEIEEEKIRQTLNADLNMMSCNGVDTELRRKYHIEYRGQHKEQSKKYREEHKEHNKEYKIKHYQQNREQILKYMKEFRRQNKERINEKTKEKMTCECGSCVRRGDIARHKRTKKHMLFLEQK